MDFTSSSAPASAIKRLGNINAELRKVESRLEEHRALLEAANSRVAAADEKFETLSNKKRQLREELTEVKTKLQKNEEEHEYHTNEVKRQQLMVDDVEKEREEVQKRKEALSHDVEMEKTELLQRVEAITSQCPEFMSELQRKFGSPETEESEPISTRLRKRSAQSDDEETTEEEDEIAFEWQMYVMNGLMALRSKWKKRKHAPTKKNLLEYVRDREERDQPVPRRRDEKSLDLVYDRLIPMRLLSKKDFLQEPDFKERMLNRMREEKKNLRG